MEQEKCKWLLQAAVNRGIQPVVQCVQSIDKLGCLEDIENGKADVVTVEAEYGYVAKR